ncbi:efflux RND transporter permease subunit [Candidatus Vampirococcus lugosii]|uniref:Cation efflux system protein CusA, N-term part n=1 Tax=Candidatus Vampirococcus lugosii TaxID=2789015 RepID=A0ABS5QK06_9BACT|nr:efflux RND transporter permease subunit [Candidatus Vampirococcus lugosii]MBS8121591.1 Cation efflux system protein CusA, N-term part [Candidatus Vampirococcus lugosii]
MKDFVKNLESGFFAFWVNKYKVSFILILAVLILGIGAIIQIPKESSPNIEIPILQITTTYQGVNADDIDSLITDKIVRGLNSINGIKQIDATSSLGLSVISLELNDNINPKEKLIDVQDEIDKISFPSDADEPTVSNITTENQLIFNLVIYSQIYSQDELKEKARQIRDNLEGKNGLSKIEILGSADYEYKINVKQGILDQIGLSVSDIGQTIRSYDSNFPLGNYTVGNSDYDFRIDGEFEEIDEIMNLIVHGQDSSYVKLSDIADYHIEYEDDNKRFVGLPENNNIYNSVVLSFEKNQQTDIFNASSFAKSEIESLFETNDFNGIEYLYTSDLASTIIKDYKSLAKNGGTTVFLVFILLLIFVGFKQSLLATLILPLSFFDYIFCIRCLMIDNEFFDELFFSFEFLNSYRCYYCYHRMSKGKVKIMIFK